MIFSRVPVQIWKLESHFCHLLKWTWVIPLLRDTSLLSLALRTHVAALPRQVSHCQGSENSADPVKTSQRNFTKSSRPRATRHQTWKEKRCVHRISIPGTPLSLMVWPITLYSLAVKGSCLYYLEYSGLTLLGGPACLRSQTNPQTVILRCPHL